MGSVILAETVQLDGGDLTVIFLLIFGVPLALVALALFGLRWASRAGHGDDGAMRRVGVLVGAEVLGAVWLGQAVGTNILTNGLGLAVLAQTVAFGLARSEEKRRDDGGGHDDGAR